MNMLSYSISSASKVFNETENKVKQGKERKKEEEAYSQAKMHLTRRKKFKRKD
jgi:hypothetical protein